jgi:hypothetical protein
VDETALFFSSQSTRTLAIKGGTCHGGKKLTATLLWCKEEWKLRTTLYGQVQKTMLHEKYKELTM